MFYKKPACWIILFWVLLSASCAGVRGDRPVFTAPGLSPDPKMVHKTLDNGFTYILYKNSTPENRVSMHLDVLAGSINETDQQKGAAHYLEHMLFNGSEHFKPGELVEYFQSIGMSFGADANASTGFYETVYDLSLPKGDKKSLSDALLVMDDYARGALLLESEIEKERGVILSEKRQRDSVSYRTFKSSFEFELPDSRLVERFPIGTVECIKNTDQRLLKDFYDTWYRPSHMVLVMVGDFDTGTAMDLIEDRFSGFTPRAPERDRPDSGFSPHKGIKPFYHYEPEAGSTRVTIETVSNEPFERQTLSKLKERTVKDMADTIVSHRMAGLPNQEGSPVSDTSVFSGTSLRTVSFSSIGAETTPGGWKESLELVEQNLRQALEYGFTEAELDRVKKEYINRLDLAVEKSGTRKSSAIARRIIHHVNGKKIFQSPEQKRDILKPFIQSLDVQSVSEAFSDTWDQGHRLVLVTGNARIKDGEEQAENTIKTVYQQSMDRKVESPGKEEAVTFPYLPVPSGKGGIETSKRYPDLEIQTVDFANSVRLNYKKTDFTKGELIFSVKIPGGGKTVPLEKPGLAETADRVVNESGVGGLDKEKLKEALAGSSVNIRFNIKEDAFVFSGKAASSEIELLFQLIRTHIQDPAFRPSSLALVKKRYQQKYKEWVRRPQGIMKVKGEKFLAGGDPRFGMAGPAEVENITIEDIKSWLLPYFNKAPLEVSVVGDFDRETLESAAAEYLGTFDDRSEYPRSSPSSAAPSFPGGETLTLDLDTRIDKSRIEVAFLTDDFWDIQQTRELNLLSRVFSERLRKTVREKLGAAYTTYVYNSPSKAYHRYGVLHAVAGVDRKDIKTILAQMTDIAQSLASQGITKKELSLAKKPVMNHIRDMRRENKYWLNSVLSGSMNHPEQLEWAGNLVEGYASISADDLDRTAKKFLDTDRCAKIIIQPENKE